MPILHVQPRLPIDECDDSSLAQPNIDPHAVFSPQPCRIWLAPKTFALVRFTWALESAKSRCYRAEQCDDVDDSENGWHVDMLHSYKPLSGLCQRRRQQSSGRGTAYWLHMQQLPSCSCSCSWLLLLLQPLRLRLRGRLLRRRRRRLRLPLRLRRLRLLRLLTRLQRLPQKWDDHDCYCWNNSATTATAATTTTIITNNNE